VRGRFVARGQARVRFTAVSTSSSGEICRRTSRRTVSVRRRSAGRVPATPRG
jgi:hypothetical protein